VKEGQRRLGQKEVPEKENQTRRGETRKHNARFPTPTREGKHASSCPGRKGPGEGQQYQKRSLLTGIVLKDCGKN